MGEFDNKIVCTKSKITNIANQIRTELSESNTYKIDDMPAKIHAVASAGTATIEPLTITQNGTYNATTEIDGYAPVVVNVEGGSATEATKIKIVKSLPGTLTNGAVYLIPNETILPAIPSDTGLTKFIITANLDDALNDYDDATEFYLMCSDLGLHTDFIGEGANKNLLTFTNSGGVTSGEDSPPTKAYKYTVGGSLQWTEVTVSTIWNTESYKKLTNVVYASENITQRRSEEFRYGTASNIVDSDGKASDLYHVFNYKVYYVSNGSASNLGNHDLKWVASNFR